MSLFSHHYLTTPTVTDDSTYASTLLATFPSPQLYYHLENGATSAERAGGGAGSLTYAGGPTYLGGAVHDVEGGMRFNGTDQAASASHHASMNIGSSDFWLHFLFNTDNDGWPAAIEYIFGHDGDGGAGTWEARALTSNRLSARLHGTDAAVTTTTAKGTGWHQAVFTADRDGNSQWYVDAATDGAAVDISLQSAALDASVTLYVARRQTTGYCGIDLAHVAMGLGLPSAGNISTVWAAR